MYIFIFVGLLILCYLLSLYLDLREHSIFRRVLEANNLFCIQYLFFSACFIVLEDFAVWKPLICIGIADILIVLWIIYKKIEKKKNNYKIQKNEWIILLITIFCCFPLIRITVEDIGAASDQGGYFAHTINYMEEKDSEIHQLKEMGVISEAVDEGLEELQSKLMFYSLDEGKYYLHALGTWCVFPALFGKMFGIWNCMKAVNYLYILGVWNMFYLCRRIAANRYNQYFAIGIYGLSPLILYIGKAGLTEVVIVLLFLIGLNYLLENKRYFYILAGISVGLVGFIHVSIFIYMPVITFVAALESVKKEKKDIAIFNLIQLFMFAVSEWYAYIISPFYTKRQYDSFTLHGKISHIVFFIIIDILILFLICYQKEIYRNRRKKLIWKIRDFLITYFKPIIFVLFLIIFLSTAYNIYCLGFTEMASIPEGVDAGSWNLRERYINTGLNVISYFNIVNIARAVGLIGLFVFFLIPFIKRELKENLKIFYYIGVYGIFIYTVLRVDTPFNYYASRYFVPLVVPMIVICLAAFVEKKTMSIYILLVSFLFNRYYYAAFLEGGPCVGQYKILQDALEIISEDEIVFCDSEDQKINSLLINNLRILNNNEVYNLENYDAVSEFYPDKEKYIISGKEREIEGELLLSGIYISQYSFGNGLNGSYAREIGTYEIPVYIYKMK